MKPLHFCVVLGVVALLVVGPARAETVLVVSDVDPTDPAGYDASLVTWLEGLGYTVDTDGMNGNYKEGNSPWAAGNEAKLQRLLDADLVIVSRKTSSGSYDNDRAGWNTLATPLILMSGYLTRGASQTKWYWANVDSGDAGKAVTDLVVEAGQTGHSWLAGVTLDGADSFAGFDWSPLAEAPKAVYLPNTGATWADGATVLATYDGRDILVDIPAGAEMINGDIAGARRGFLGQWGYDLNIDVGAGSRKAQFEDFLTDDYKTVLSNMIAEMVPEPGTIALLGFGGLAALLRRKRQA